MKQLRQTIDTILGVLLALLVLGALVYGLVKYEVEWPTALAVSTFCGGVFFSAIIGGIRGETGIDGLPPIVITEAWLISAVFFTLLWAIIELLDIKIR